MGQFKYVLEQYKGPNSRYTCLGCGKKRQFTRYVNTDTGEYVADHVGICNRRNKCGYHYPPKDYFTDTDIKKTSFPLSRASSHLESRKQIIAFPKDIVRKSLAVASYQENNFIKFLLKFLDKEIVSGLVEKYFIGTSNYWPGATVFWLIDDKGQFLGGQVVSFDCTTGRTLRINGKRCTSWVHKALQHKFIKKDKNLPVWLKEYLEHAEKYPIPFGLHLAAQEQNKPIAIVEAPKTAVIASAFFPGFTWLAIGSLSWLNKKRLMSLAGRQVVLFPDISSNGSAFEVWRRKARELDRLVDVTISSFLEQIATKEERGQGLDIADYLVRCYLDRN